MILQGSRYQTQPVLSVPIDATGHTRLVVYGPPPTAPAKFQYYTVQMGDRLDLIAANVLGRSDLWWSIAQANPEVFYPDALVPGAMIRIPMA